MVASTAALTQLWVRQRAQTRQLQPAALSATEPHIPRTALHAYHADQQKALGIVLAVSFASLLIVALAAGSRRSSAPNPETVARSRGEMNQVEHFARTAAVREQDLRREREERLRMDENLHVQQLLLNHALGEKLRLGRDLHDGVIQSLYATGLTLESARQKRPVDPSASDALFERGMQMLNDNIREIRNHINSLSHPQPTLKHGFSNALAAIIETMKGERTTEFILRIDEDAEARLDLSQMPDALQILREAVSNALRHGAASRVTIRLHRDGERLALLVQDDGVGFDLAARPSDGHGLVNFRARAESLGADFRLDSQPGNGTRVVLTLPILAPHP
ncbi:MAG: ATP-binding protein [Opitutaceae bacterium]|nr:ATP-binding protein [Opitutaceae bacterium]